MSKMHLGFDFSKCGDIFATTALILAIVTRSNMLEIVPYGDLFRSSFLISMLGLAIWGILYCVLRGRFLISAVSIIFLISIWLYLYLFSIKTGAAFIATAGGMYFAGCLSALFYRAHRRGELEQSLHVFAWASVLYAGVYIIVSLGVSAGLIRVPPGGQLLIGADEFIQRSTRVGLMSIPVCFAIAYFINRSFVKINWVEILACCILFFAIWQSQSRTILVIAAVSIVLYLAVRSARALAVTGLACLAIGLSVSLYVAFTPTFNPFDAAARDNSVRVRSNSIQIAQALVPDAWLTGWGVPSGGAGYVQVSNSRTFHPSDIGFIGVIVSHGILGLLVYAMVCVSGCLAGIRAKVAGFSSEMALALSCTGMIGAIYSIQAPVYLGSSGAVFASLFLTLLFVPKEKRKGSPSSRGRLSKD